VEMGVTSIQSGGHVFYVGAGTSGRIAMLDATECPPTFSTPDDWVQAILAGGAKAMSQAKEGFEDDAGLAIEDLKTRKVAANDCVVGIAASGSTPYTLAALEFAKEQ